VVERRSEDYLSLFHLPIFLTGLSNTPCIPPRQLESWKAGVIALLILYMQDVYSVSGEIKGSV